jgi:hypothetical protein
MAAERNHKKAKRTDKEYLDFNPFEGDRDVDIQGYKVRIVSTRKEHKCMAGYLQVNGGDSHTIPARSRAWLETAIVDGEPGSCYCCLPCLDKLMDEIYGD